MSATVTTPSALTPAMAFSVEEYWARVVTSRVEPSEYRAVTRSGRVAFFAYCWCFGSISTPARAGVPGGR